MKFQSDETQWAVDGARRMLELGINVQATGPATDMLVTGMIRSLLAHVDNLKADLDVAVAVGRYAAKMPRPDKS